MTTMTSPSEPTRAIDIPQVKEFLEKMKKDIRSDDIEVVVECIAAVKDSLDKILTMLENVHAILEHQKKEIDRIKEFVPSIE